MTVFGIRYDKRHSWTRTCARLFEGQTMISIMLYKDENGHIVFEKPDDSQF